MQERLRLEPQTLEAGSDDSCSTGHRTCRRIFFSSSERRLWPFEPSQRSGKKYCRELFTACYFVHCGDGTSRLACAWLQAAFARLVTTWSLSPHIGRDVRTGIAMWSRALHGASKGPQGCRLLGSWANLDATKMSGANPAQAYNLGALH